MNSRKRQHGEWLVMALLLIAPGAVQVCHAAPGQQQGAGRFRHREGNPARRQALVAAVIAQARRDATEDGGQAAKNGGVYFVVSFGARRYEYRMKEWKLAAEKTGQKQQGSGISENWANVRVDMLDSHRKSNVQGADWLFHFNKGHWRRVALNEGPGYERKRLHELGMSDAQIQRLDLEVNE